MSARFSAVYLTRCGHRLSAEGWLNRWIYGTLRYVGMVLWIARLRLDLSTVERQASGAGAARLAVDGGPRVPRNPWGRQHF